MNVTPNGKLTGFVAIEKPSTKFNEDGVYSCQVEFTGDDAKKMKKAIDKLMAKSASNNKKINKAAQPPYTIDGKTLIVKFKQKARIKTNSGKVWEKEVKVFDSQNNKVEEPLFMGEGSTVRVAYEPYLWQVNALGCGCTLQLEMVQVIDLVKREATEPENPFDAVEGFTAANKDANPFESDESEAAEDEEDDDIDF